MTIESVLLVLAAVVALGAVALRFAPAALAGGRMGAMWTVFAATPYKVASRYKYIDSLGRKLGVLPLTLRMSGTDVAGAKLTFDDMPAGSVAYVVPPGPHGAVAIVFEDLKYIGAAVNDVKAIELLLGPTGQSTGTQLSTDLAFNSAVSAQSRLQGLEDVPFGIGQTLQFNQKA